MDRSLRVRAAVEAKGPLQVLRSGLQEHGLVTSAENTLLATHIIGALSEMPPCRGRSLQPESLSPTLNSLASCDSCCRMERDKSRQPAFGRRYQRQSVFLEILAGHGVRVRGAGGFNVSVPVRSESDALAYPASEPDRNQDSTPDLSLGAQPTRESRCLLVIQAHALGHRQSHRSKAWIAQIRNLTDVPSLPPSLGLSKSSKKR